MRASPITGWVILNDESNCLLENIMVCQEPITNNGLLGIYINLETYQISVVWSVKHFTCYIEGELHMKSILCDAQLLTLHKLSAKCLHLTVNRAFVLNGLVLLTEVKIVESTHLCYHEDNSVVTTNCCRNDKKSRHGLCILYLEVGCEYVVW